MSRMSNPTQNRAPGGIPTGGQFARNGQTESEVCLDDSSAPSRFASNAAGRSGPVPQYIEGAQAYRSEVRQAQAYLRDFRTGDVVAITSEQGQEHFAKITRDRLSDGDYGSPESRTLGVSLGTNRYSYDVNSHKLALGQMGMRHIRPDEQSAANTQFAAADDAWAITKQERIDAANVRLVAANLPAVGEQAVAWEGTASEVRGTVHDMTERGSVGFVIDGRPGSSLVPAESVSRVAG